MGKLLNIKLNGASPSTASTLQLSTALDPHNKILEEKETECKDMEFVL